jgi:multidrug efflux system membrane fusion protein
VIGTHAQRGNIAVYLNGLGSVTPINTVTVRSRVDGELTRVAYKEGDLVTKGDVLVEIDPRPFQAVLTQAQGTLQKDRATLANARIDLARYQTLVATHAIPEQQLATQKATVGELEGTVKSDEGQVEAARLNVEYCRITAPLTGRVGLRLVDPGNIVHAADANGLVVITQIEPISVIFTTSEEQLPQVMQKVQAHQKLRAELYDRDMQTHLSTGVLETVDNQIDQTTGTVRLRATFENRDARLFPNEFVNVRLLLQQKNNVVLLNTATIQRSATQTYVYVVKEDSTVTVRQIQTGVTEGENTEITSGLNGGEAVVMTGVDKLQEGTPVTVQFPGEPGHAKTGGKRK